MSSSAAPTPPGGGSLPPQAGNDGRRRRVPGGAWGQGGKPGRRRGALTSSSNLLRTVRRSTAARNRRLPAGIDRARQRVRVFRAGPHVFSVRLRQRVGEPHHTARPGAVPEPEGVAEFVDGLGGGASTEPVRAFRGQAQPRSR